MNHSDDQVMTIMDETTNNFIFYSNINESIGHLMPFKTGDVIRVHRLALNPNFIRRNTHVKNIVVSMVNLNKLNNDKILIILDI